MGDLTEEKPRPIYAAVLVCQQVILDDEDKVPTAIRIVDIFHVHDVPEIPPEKRPVPMQALFTVRFPVGDESEHSIELLVERPDGGQTPIGTATVEADPSKATEVNVPNGINLRLRFGVFPKQWGLHYLVAHVDAKEVARVPFSLVRRSSIQAATHAPQQSPQ